MKKLLAVGAMLGLSTAVGPASGAEMMMASAYTPADSGSQTASGIPLDWQTPTVAHRSLAFHTKLRICLGRRTERVQTHIGVNVGTAAARLVYRWRNRVVPNCVIAEVTDRGPFVAGRDIDLSPGVFNALGYGSRTVAVTII